MYHTHWPGEDRMKEIDITNVTIKFERTQGPQKPNGYLQQPPPTMMKFHLKKCMQQNHHTPEGPKQS